MDEHASERFTEGARVKMSESEVATLRAEIRNLSEKADRQHAANQESQRQDRETFRAAVQTQQQTFASAMDSQRQAFQEALNKQFMLHTVLDKVVDRHTLLITNVMGDGQPGEGRVGALETGIEVLKKFRWQALSIVALMMWAVETWVHHGH